MVENSQSQEADLERTDVLPVLEGITFDSDVDDDAVRLDPTVARTSVPVVSKTAVVDFPRSSAVDLPSLAESVRSVEDRIARQSAEYEALAQSYEKAQEAEAAAFARASTLGADLATTRSALEAEQVRGREIDRALVEQTAAVQTAAASTAEMARKSEQYQSESLALRESLAARDANVLQILNSLNERDAQLSALQREHAKVVPELQTIAANNAQLDAELKAARTRADALSVELKNSQSEATSMASQTKGVESELSSTRRELQSTAERATSFLERLRTREWRLGFDLNLFRELDADVGAAQASQDVLRAERDQLSRQLATVEARYLSEQATVQQLQQAATASTVQVDGLTKQLAENDSARSELSAQVARLTGERTALQSDVQSRDQAIAEAKAASAAEAQRVREALASEHAKQAELSARITRMETEASTSEQAMAVLTAHLREARKPLDPIEAEVKRLTEELGVKSAAVDKLTEESRELRATLERTRGALEEREFLIRRLERSESTNAAVLGRIQTSIERLGTAAAGDTPAAPTAEYSAELVRIDGEHAFRHALTRRTRIGRAAICELQIESSSVSRQHALILLGRREVIIEDLNSTNGVMVNGRKVSRQMLNDGDLVMIGDIKFRLAVKQPLSLPEPGSEAPPPPPPAPV